MVETEPKRDVPYTSQFSQSPQDSDTFDRSSQPAVAYAGFKINDTLTSCSHLLFSIIQAAYGRCRFKANHPLTKTIQSSFTVM